MAEFPAMPLWTDAYLADTGHLTATEHGAYLLLLMAAWRSGGRLPDDDKKLARFAHVTSGQWKRMKDTIRDFFTVEDGHLVQGRQMETLAAVRQKSQSAKNSARAKYRKNNKPPPANAAETQSVRTPNQNQSERKKEGANAPSKEATRSGPRELPSEWEVGADLIAYAAGYGFSATEARQFGEEMRSWAEAKGVRRKSWHATFQTIVQRRAKDRQRSTGPPSRGPSYSDISRWAEDELAKLESQPNDHRSDSVLRLVAN